VLAFAGYLFGFTNLQAERAQQHLASALIGSAGLAALTGKVPAEGQPVALLQIPALHLKQVVVQGTSARDLENGPGLMLGAAPPGTAGNTVIAGRRSTFGAPFANLGSLRRGALVRVTGGLGSFSYRISRIETISIGQVEPIGATATARLTLVTSNPAVTASGLLVAVATLVGRPVATVPPYAVAPPPSHFGLQGDPTASTPALLAGEAFVVVAVGTLLVYRRWRHLWAVYILAVPLLLALLVVCFENIAALLPATL
jgi:sortase A